jgi:uncharacterized membrane protein
MPSILLINDNKIVSRLLQLSSEKNGYNLKEVSTLESLGGSYDVVFVDGDKYNDSLMGEIESKLRYGQLGYIGTKQGTTPEGFNLVIEKPFLPTDFVDMIKEQVIAKKFDDSSEADDELNGFDIDDEADVLLEDDSLSLDDIDDGVEKLLISDDIENIEDELSLADLDDDLAELDDIDLEDDTDLSLDPSLMMTTGVAASMASTENSTENLAEMVNEIDLMKDDGLDLIDEPLDLIEEIEEKTLESSLVGELEEVSLDLDKEEQLEVNIENLVAASAGIAVAGAVASNVLADDAPKIIEDIKEEIVTLDDIDSLNEADLQSALGEEVVEEIINEEVIVDGEETLVESNDVEAWIRDAVAKAITPQMIKEALDGMDINVTLSFNAKKEDNSTL